MTPDPAIAPQTSGAHPDPPTRCVLLAYVGARLGAGRPESGMPYDEFERRAFPVEEKSGATSSSRFRSDERAPVSSGS